MNQEALKEKLQVMKNKAKLYTVKVSGAEKYRTHVIKSIVITSSGKIEIFDTFASMKMMGFSYQVNEVWREITPEAKLSYKGHDAYIYIGNRMQPLRFDNESFEVVTAKAFKQTIEDESGEVVEQEALQGLSTTGKGYVYVDPSNFKRILNAKILGELMEREKNFIEKNALLIGLAIVAGLVYMVAKGVFGVDLLAG